MLHGGAPNAFAGCCCSRNEARLLWMQKSSHRVAIFRTDWRRIPLLVTTCAQQIGVFGEPDWGFGREQQQQKQNLQQQQQQQQIGGLRSRSSRVFAKWKWWGRKGESSLNNMDDALPVPMTRPDADPISKEEINKLESCNPEKEDCKPVVYEWTGECKRCQGTGMTNFYRKNGREVISKCISCLGIGYVHKFTTRNIEMEDLD